MTRKLKPNQKQRRINNRSAAFLISTLDVQDPHIKGIDFPIQ